MYYCTDCKQFFKTPKTLREHHGDLPAPFEEWLCCPKCESTEIEETDKKYCKCCGKTLKKDQVGYCSEECLNTALLIKKRKIKDRTLGFSKSISLTVKLVTLYNLKNKTKLSYGQFVSLVLPKIKKEELKLWKKEILSASI